MNRILVFFMTAFFLIVINAFTQEDKSWVERSNENSQILLNILAKASPETAGEIGMSGLDVEIRDLKPGFEERVMKMLEDAKTELGKKLETEKHPAVQQDLEILITSAQMNIEEINLEEKYILPYYNVSGIVYRGIRSLLDEQVAPERRKASVERLKNIRVLRRDINPSLNWQKTICVSIFRTRI